MKSREAEKDQSLSTVELGDLGSRIQARINSGEFDSAAEVIEAGLEALDREDADFDGYLREKVEESLSDPRPSIPAEEVFERLLRRHEELLKSDGLEA